MNISIIIPTFNRYDDLSQTLDSIFHQTTSPEEILIIDDSDNESISNLINGESSRFDKRGIDLKYFRNPHQKGSGIARNFGMKLAFGDIILFLDDDVILDPDYITEILKVYKQYPHVIGVQGYITNFKQFSRFKFLYNKIFYRYNQEKNKCKVLVSTNIVYPSSVDEMIECEWLSGCNQSYRKNKIADFTFDENFRRYSLKEDVDLSYRIYKRNPGSLLLTPSAKLVHKAVDVARMPGKTIRCMEYVHSFYLFSKNIDQNLINILKFYWAWGGEILLSSPWFIFTKFRKGSQEGYLYWKYGCEAFLFCLKNSKKIKAGNLSFFHKYIGA